MTLKIGITIGLQHPAEDFWNNGIKQNALFLAMALARIPGAAPVRLVNMTAVPVTASLGWDLARWPVATFDEARDDLDILIELGGQVGPAETDYLKRRGTRLVSYCCGSEYVAVTQAILFGREPAGELFVNPRYDAIWMIPQVAELSSGYFSTFRRRPTQVVPFVWDPVLIEDAGRAHPDEGQYRPRPGPRRITVIEPNVDVVKFCLYPTLIVEEAFRAAPELIAYLHVTNADRLATESRSFAMHMNQLDIVRAHKASFVARYRTQDALSGFTDAVVSHQWGNPMNYLYFEVCWQGYPLVHNASLCADIGYYYPGHDLAAGAQQLLIALRTHDADWEARRRADRRRLERHRPHDPALVDTYARLVQGLLAQPPA